MEEYEYRWIGTDEDLINNGFKLEIDYEIYATKDNSWSFCVDRRIIKKGVTKQYPCFKKG